MAEGIPVWETAWSVREFAPDEVIEEVSCQPVDSLNDGLNWQGNRIPTDEDFEIAAIGRGVPGDGGPDDVDEDPEAPAGEAAETDAPA
ncbi:MAG: hypothetical protein HOV71_17685 [Hamadaea sp.]|uniref:hypothetical protein n=1 Tax=Hamadaea sp. TaxID=2024425 RepID=UPI00178EA03E|nr:hypothetical protein [Hamadaea sp.]NUR49959.1 hypothetical protein [Hamadaea sp.]NUR71849.1 hypothetical protein [Hamadaea sp.]NUT22593.1 hypothetical protein [Hamadaea sp.]